MKTENDIIFLDPLTLEQQVERSNLTHDDFHIFLEYLTKEEIKEKYGEILHPRYRGY